jgi:sugar phosphate isomerase/epimerase
MRLALCGNVFPADTPAAVCAALRGPVQELSALLREHGWPGEPGFGLYLAHRAAREFRRDPARMAKLRAALSRAGVAVWTANAFPFGGFHGTRVKEQAFQPDWRSTERLQFTLDVAEVLAEIAPGEGVRSVSTCPLGYGPDAVRSARTVEHLQRVQEAFVDLEARTGQRFVLAIEPEPDGGFERVTGLATWIAERLPDADRIGVCWDLCHSAVVGETAEDVLATLQETGVPVGKVQVSAALAVRGRFGPAAAARLAAFADDPYLHQVRGRDLEGRPRAWSDLPRLLARDPLPEVEDLRVHCHVPLHHDDYGDGLTPTPWRAALAAAVAAGIRDFEVETYTLPVLPEALRAEGMVATMAAEMRACGSALGLVDADS